MLHALQLTPADSTGRLVYNSKTKSRSVFTLQHSRSQKSIHPAAVIRKPLPSDIPLNTPSATSVKYLAIPMDSLLMNAGNPITIQILYDKPRIKESVPTERHQVESNIDEPLAASTDLASDPFLCQRMEEPASNGIIDEHAGEMDLYKSTENEDRLAHFDDYNELEPQLEPFYDDFHSEFPEVEPSSSMLQGTVIKRSGEGFVLPVASETPILKKFKCTFPNCGKMFERQRSLRYHHITHAPPVFSCNVCQKRFVTMPKLKRHLRIHNGERPFSCEECGKSFSTNSNLNVHRRKHTGEKPFACSICGRLFAHHSHAKTHLKVHEKERNYRNAQTFPRLSLADWSYLQK
ncbi:unnamed protein product [Bursaphelenchus xylophilus]|uniref:(pine wood nematode) hypothetical protein n=1 Tax=Bursaphelenchus xylophilus TaxID=6326 RepID=A0A1I7RHJ7_BURXY|nr:unnamed protein product [Bursaphelenchus xylophilus]CAG9115677.1 unnamed protein product [Bursaphelenchus xylophilus]